MTRNPLRTWVSTLLLGLAMLCSPLSAALTQNGNVTPDVNLWTATTNGLIGNSTAGSVLVDEGSVLNSNLAYLGYLAGSTGTATVQGAGSQWTNNSELYVGHDGSGTLTVAAEGEVVTAELYASLSDLLGNGTITATKGALLDAELMFDAAHGSQQNLAFGSGGTLNANFDGGVLGVGYKQSGSLTVADGVEISSSDGYLGYRSGSTGAAKVTGTGSAWMLSHVNVSHKGSGSLIIESGGLVKSIQGAIGRYAGATGTATVTGTGSHWLNDFRLSIGLEGNGMLTVEAGGQVSSPHVEIGRLSGATGTVLVTGNGTTWTSNSLFVGYGGSGMLTVEAGGQVSSPHVEIGRLSGATGTALVTGNGSAWTNGYLYVGSSGDGTLTIEAGGRVSTARCHIGLNPDATGTALVNGTNSMWANGFLNVGLFGTGTLTIQAGGQVRSSVASIGKQAGATGTVTVTGTGSKWTNSGALHVGYEGSGSLAVADGGEVIAADLYASHSDLFGNGTITATKGAVLDVELAFDSQHGSQQDFAFGTGGALSANFDGGVLGVGYRQSGRLIVADGVEISSSDGYLGYRSGSTGTAKVTGMGSRWKASQRLYVGRLGSGTLEITRGGLVSVGDTLWIDAAYPFGESYINLATGGKLALFGDADDSLSQFLALVYGTDAIRYWDSSVGNWAPLTAASYGTDYTLRYLTAGELAGYTLLTVGTLVVPEPSCLALLFGLVCLRRHRLSA